jgi:hypothetical protein
VTPGGDHAFVAGGRSGMQVISTRDPAAPTRAGTRSAPKAPGKSPTWKPAR